MVMLPRLAAFLVAALIPLAASAQGTPPNAEDIAKSEIVASLWCDTPDQLEIVLRAHYTNKVPMGDAMAAINRNSPEACVVARAIVAPGAEVRRLTAGDNIMSLRSAKVMGIMRGPYALMMRPQIWYYVRIVAELTPV